MKMKITILIIAQFSIFIFKSYCQPVPSLDEKFPFLSIFGKNASTEWGDDDFSQTFFFVVPQSEKNPLYIRVFDPDVGGKHDEVHEKDFNTKIRYSVYGGKGAHSDSISRKAHPSGNYKTGIQLASKTIGKDLALDDNWLTLGPFNPTEGELQTDFGGYVFKIVIEGIEGDDGNMYRLFLSSKANENKPIEGGNAFAYEYCLRMSDVKGSTCHLYPFIASNVIAVQIHVFDFDDDGIIRVISVSKKGEGIKSSGNNVWKINNQVTTKEELNTSYDIQFIKQNQIKDNNVVVFITNQYGEMLPFFAAPIGGVPKFKYKIGVKTGK